MSQKRTSLENALHLLKLFSMDEPELSVTEVSEKLGVAKSTAHRLLSSLAQEGFVYKDSQSNLYSLGFSILRLVEIVNSQIHISSEAIPILNTLVEEIGENAHLAILDGFDVVILQTISGDYSSIDYIHLGRRLPSFCTSSGKAILAFNPDIAKDVAKIMKPYTNKTIVDPKLFFAELEKIRKQQYVISVREYKDDITSIGVPVFNEVGHVIASITITIDYERATSNRVQNHYVSLLQRAGRELTKIIKMRKRGHVT